MSKKYLSYAAVGAEGTDGRHAEHAAGGEGSGVRSSADTTARRVMRKPEPGEARTRRRAVGVPGRFSPA